VPLETARFFLRRFTTEDVGRYHLLTCSEPVMRFVTGRAFTWAETEEKFARILAKSALDERAGVHAIHDRDTGEFVGAAAVMREPSDRVEIGYRIVETHWGRGIATEVAAALLRFGASALQARTIVAYVDAENAASIRVLEKIGMQRGAAHAEGGRLEYEYLWNAL
jgi:RimJ/RimL family protein N-acetyltransferase